MHFPEPMPAFDAITAEAPYTALGANTARMFVFPTTLGKRGTDKTRWPAATNGS
jgi:hypothetical protein